MSPVQLLTLTLLATFSQAFYHQPTFLDPVYDQYGYEITSDRLLEMTAMKATSLGYGFGSNYSEGFTPYQPPVLPPYLVQGRGYNQGRNTDRSHPQGYNTPRGYSPNPNFNQPGRTVSSYGRVPSQSPSLSFSFAHSDTGGTKYSPFEHRRFKRQAVFPEVGLPGNDLFQHLSGRPAHVDFGFTPLNRPSGSSFLGDSPFGSGSSASSPSPSITSGLDSVSFGPQPALGQNPNNCNRQQSITCNKDAPYRTVDGLCNNLDRPKWGAALQPLRRLHKNHYYYDGLDAPRMTSSVNPTRLLPSARLVSRLVHEPDRDGQNIPELTNMVQQWGQFLDHDLTGTPAHKGADGKDLKCCANVYLSEERQVHSDVFNGGVCNPIYIPPLDRHFTSSCMNFARSQAAPRQSDCDPRAAQEPREQMNMLTAFIDASQVYGSSLKENRAIRVYRGGLLRVTHLDLLPEDANSTCVKEKANDYCFKAGEMRVNEHPALTSMHTIFHRLHNQMAYGFSQINPSWSDEKIFQEVRKIIGAVMQHVTYHEWIPIILGPATVRELNLAVSGPYDGQLQTGAFWFYDRRINPTIINSFATAAFRFGHTLIPSSFTVGNEKIRLHRMFNRPQFVLRDEGRSISKFCDGLMQDSVQHFDRFVTTDLTDRLFEDLHNMSMDLGALNIHRGRDHGLPGYNEFREICGLTRIKGWDELYQDDPDRAEVFRRVYDHVDDIDLFPGGVSERPLAGAVVGPTFACILGKQFRNLKFGDRFWYENEDNVVGFTPDQRQEIRTFTLSKIMCSMAPVGKVTVNPFFRNGAFLPKPIRLLNGDVITQNRYVDCELLPDIDLYKWYERRSRG